MKEPHLTPPELERRWAKTLKTGRKTLANWRCDPEGRGPDFRKLGGRVLYPLSAVEHFEDTGEHRSPEGGYPSQANAREAAADPPSASGAPANVALLRVSGDAALSAMQAEIRALDLRRARLATHYRWQLARSLGRKALRRAARRDPDDGRVGA